MSSLGFVVDYVRWCASGALSAAECGPIWHLSVIVILLLGAIATLIVFRVRARLQPARS